MKQITFLAAFLVAFSMNAQLFSDDFEDADISDWTQIDEDGDGEVFFAYTGGGTGNYMTSASWTSGTGPLTPNNYSVSPAIDVTGATELFLNYRVGGQDPAYSAEVYTVYVSTGNTIADFEDAGSSVSFMEDLGDDPGAAGDFVSRTLDASALAGATSVYIAFRHHDVTDQFYINFDDVVLDTALATEEIGTTEIDYRVIGNELVITSPEALTSVQLFNLLGQNMLTKAINGNEARIDISSMAKGVYIANISNENSQTAVKFLKN